MTITPLQRREGEGPVYTPEEVAEESGKEVNKHSEASGLRRDRSSKVLLVGSLVTLHHRVGIFPAALVTQVTEGKILEVCGESSSKRMPSQPPD